MWGQIFSLAQLKGSLALELGIVKIMYVSSTLMLAALFWRLAPIQHQLKKKKDIIWKCKKSKFIML